MTETPIHHVLRQYDRAIQRAPNRHVAEWLLEAGAKEIEAHLVELQRQAARDMGRVYRQEGER